MYKDKEKQREVTKDRVRRYRERKGVTGPEGVTEELSVTNKDLPWYDRASEAVADVEGITPSKSRLKRIAIQKGVTEGIPVEEGVTMTWNSNEDLAMNDGSRFSLDSYPDIIDKLTDPIWRGKLEKICNAFNASSNPSYSKDVWLGDTNLSVACDWLECTSSI